MVGHDGVIVDCRFGSTFHYIRKCTLFRTVGTKAEEGLIPSSCTCGPQTVIARRAALAHNPVVAMQQGGEVA